jgi:hypothetical protein
VLSMKTRLRMTLGMSAAFAALALSASGCGGSSKPDYCSKVSDLQGSVDELSNVKPESGALETVQVDFKEIETDAEEVVSSAKSGFPSETSALKSAISGLSAGIGQLAATPTAQELVALTSQIEGTERAAKELASATQSACE